MVDVTLIGTSALLPLPERAESAAVISCSGHSILLDCGEGTQIALRKAGLSPIRIDLIALTHYHGDHIFGLPGLLQTMDVLERTEPLFITGPRGLTEAMAPILRMAHPKQYQVCLVSIPEEGLPLRELVPEWPAEAKLTAYPTDHRVVSQGYTFTLDRAGKFLPEKAAALGIPVRQWNVLQHGSNVECNGTVYTPDQVMGPPRKGIKVSFTGDTTLCPSLVLGSQGADLLICDATYGENGQEDMAKEYKHMNFAMAARTAAEAGVRELWLTHYSQMIRDPREYLSNATAIFPNTVCGKDGLQTTINFQD